MYFLAFLRRCQMAKLIAQVSAERTVTKETQTVKHNEPSATSREQECRCASVMCLESNAFTARP